MIRILLVVDFEEKKQLAPCSCGFVFILNIAEILFLLESPDKIFNEFTEKIVLAISLQMLNTNY